MSTYAKDTEVPVEKSRSEIEGTLRRYGASQFISGWNEEAALIGFTMENRQVKFILRMPAREDFRMVKHARHNYPTRRSDEQTLKAWEQGCRQRWRALALVIKAKLEAVEAGITIFEDEFLAHIVLPNGQTVGQATIPMIARAYETGEMPKLLPDMGKG